MELSWFQTKKRGSPTIHIFSDNPPDIIALQETYHLAKMPGYITHTTENGRDVCTLIRRDITTVQHRLTTNTYDHILTELIPKKTRKDKSIFVLNIYCRPKSKAPGLADIIRQAKCLAGPNQVIIAGDFNAAHQAWGYHYQTKRGRELSEIMDQENLTLITDFNAPTRIGTSVTRDTCPDLTLTANSPSTCWRNREDNLGSDHMIIETTVQGPHYRRTLGEAKLTDWDAVRKKRNDDPHKPIDDIRTWAQDLTNDIIQHTKKIQTSDQIPAVDNHLLHLWEARRSLLRRWKRQRQNRKLRIRIANLNKEAAKYAAHLSQQNWHHTCDSLNGRLSTSKTWNLLRYLIDPSKSRGSASKTLQTILHQYPGSTEDLMETLKTRYFPDSPREPSPSIYGSTQPHPRSANNTGRGPGGPCQDPPKYITRHG